MRIWLTKNIFYFVSQTTYWREIERVHPAARTILDNIESCIQWIASMSQFTPFTNGELHCGRNVCLLFPQFFEIVKLLRKCEVHFLVNGQETLQHQHMTSRATGIDIVIRPNSVETWTCMNIDKLDKLYLKLLGLGHDSRASQRSLDSLWGDFAGLVKLYAGPGNMSPPSVLVGGGIHRHSIPGSPITNYRGPKEIYHSAFDCYLGPSSLLYPSFGAAWAAVRTVNEGNQPSTAELTPTFVTTLITGLKAYRHVLRKYRNSLFRAKKNGSAGNYAPPEYTLPCDLVFIGPPGVQDWTNHVITKRELKQYIWVCNGEMYRLNAHIAALEPFDAPIDAAIFLGLPSLALPSKPT